MLIYDEIGAGEEKMYCGQGRGIINEFVAALLVDFRVVLGVKWIASRNATELVSPVSLAGENCGKRTCGTHGGRGWLER